MRYHEPLISMRLRGRKPSRIQFETIDVGDYDHGWPERTPGVARALIEPGDVIDRLDLRFVRGCVVWIDGDTPARTRELFSVVQDHGAERVLAFYTPIDTKGNARNELILDSAGELTFPKELVRG